MTEVRIDGVRYVPVAEASVDAPALEHALIAQWGGDDWRDHYADAPSYLRVVVSDGFEEGEGESVTEFIARILAAMPTKDSQPHEEDRSDA